MQQPTRYTTGVFSCHRCGRVVQFRARDAGHAWRCTRCGRRNAVQTQHGRVHGHAHGSPLTRIDVESHDTQPVPSDYGFE